MAGLRQAKTGLFSSGKIVDYDETDAWSGGLAIHTINDWFLIKISSVSLP